MKPFVAQALFAIKMNLCAWIRALVFHPTCGVTERLIVKTCQMNQTVCSSPFCPLGSCHCSKKTKEFIFVSSTTHHTHLFRNIMVHLRENLTDLRQRNVPYITLFKHKHTSSL